MFYYISIIIKHKEMKTTFTRDSKTNKVTFYRNGIQVFDFTTSGNIVSFETGEFILI